MKKPSHKRDLFVRLKERDVLVCGICGQSLVNEWKLYEQWKEIKHGQGKKPFKRKKCNISIDHIKPKSIDKPWERGETIYGNIENLQLAHIVCNNKKGNSYASK